MGQRPLTHTKLCREWIYNHTNPCYGSGLVHNLPAELPAFCFWPTKIDYCCNFSL